MTEAGSNGIVILSGATALVQGTTVTANWYTPKTNVACGVLFIDASGVNQKANSLSDNEVNLCNFGRGGGNTSFEVYLPEPTLALYENARFLRALSASAIPHS
jgi:hypothetical protein